PMLSETSMGARRAFRSVGDYITRANCCGNSLYSRVLAGLSGFGKYFPRDAQDPPVAHLDRTPGCESGGLNSSSAPLSIVIPPAVRADVRTDDSKGAAGANGRFGKAIITIPLIRSDLSLGLDLAGLVVGTFATLGAITGIGAGVVVSRLGIRRSLTGGMIAIALGNMIGAGASHEIVLLVARIVEGIGFVGVVLAIPSTRVPRYAQGT